MRGTFSLRHKHSNERKRHNRPKKVVPTLQNVELTISHIGHRGDGCADYEGRTIFVPFTAPGDHIRADVTGDRGALIEMLEPSKDRRQAPCPHYRVCGGCSLQHLTQDYYQSWQLKQFHETLKKHSVSAEIIQPLFTVEENTRRRATLSALKRRGEITLGYLAPKSHDIVDVTACLVLDPALEALLPALRILMGDLLANGDKAKISMTKVENGVDINIEGFERELTAEERGKVADWAQGANVCRVTSDGEILAQHRAPYLTIAKENIEIPPGAFLQATQMSQEKLQTLVSEALADTKGPVADLYAGCGTFTLALAHDRPIHAFEGDGHCVKALINTAHHAKGLKPVEVSKRDLADRPLMPAELKKFAGVILDPPRNGAAPQIQQITESSVPLIVYASCNPTTFARDAAQLIEASYTLKTLTPVDQFLYSAHLECVGVFERA